MLKNGAILNNYGKIKIQTLIGHIIFKSAQLKEKNSSLNLEWALVCIRLLLILLSGNVHVNPGPNKRLLIGTFNARGLSDKIKTKRLLNYIANKRFDRVIYSLQETHMT